MDSEPMRLRWCACCLTICLTGVPFNGTLSTELSFCLTWHIYHNVAPPKYCEAGTNSKEITAV